MSEVLQSLVDAMSLGSLYALSALGIGLIFGMLRLINFAHAEFITVGIYALFAMAGAWFPLAVLVSVVTVVALALAAERLAFRPVRGAEPATMLVTSFALSYLLQNVLIVIFGARPEGLDLLPGLSQPLDVMAEPGELVPSVEKVEALKEKVETPESATLLQFPGTANAAEDELAETSYEQAAEDLAPSPTAEAKPEDTTEAKPEGGADFEAPSFFSMFDTVDPDAVAQPDEAPVEPLESGSPQIHVADVAVDASSDVGPGVLTHLWQAGANAAVSDRAQLQSLQEKLREISKRMRAG